MTKATAITPLEFYSRQLRRYGQELCDFLYGDEAKTRRTLALCFLAIALGTILDMSGFVPACAV